MTQLKKLLDALFNSPYLDKADVAAALTAGVVVFKLPLSPSQQAGLVTLIGVAYLVAHKVSQAVATPTAK